jgi:autotransporter-associated beta strand protein
MGVATGRVSSARRAVTDAATTETLKQDRRGGTLVMNGSANNSGGVVVSGGTLQIGHRRDDRHAGHRSA